MKQKFSPDGVIEIRVSKIDQLFNTLDPSPFHARDLDNDAEEYIIAWAREFPQTARIRIVIHVTDSGSTPVDVEALAEALTNYFRYRATMIKADLKEIFRLGWRYLSVGFPILLICLSASMVLEAELGRSPPSRFVEESLIIVGWVANWKPIETFLYEWWPVWRRLKLYRRLESAVVEVA